MYITIANTYDNKCLDEKVLFQHFITKEDNFKEEFELFLKFRNSKIKGCIVQNLLKSSERMRAPIVT